MATERHNRQARGKRSRGVAELIKLNRLYATLSHANQAIIKARTSQELFDSICHVAVAFGTFRMAWVGLVNEDSSRIVPVAHAGAEEGYLETINISLTREETLRGPTAQAYLTGEPVIANDIAGDPRMAFWRDRALQLNYRASTSVPIHQDGRVIGVFSVYAPEPNIFDDAQVQLLRELSRSISFALDNLRRERLLRASEASLRFEQERFREIAEHINEGFWIYDHHLQSVLYVSPAYATIWGRPAERAEYSQESILASALPEDREAMREAHGRQARGERTEIEYRIVRPDGEIRRIWERSFPIVDSAGRPFRTTGIITDITDLSNTRAQLEELNRTLEERVRERTAEVHDLYNRAPAGYHSLDRDGVFVNINQTELDWLGYTREELIGRINIRDIMTPASRVVFETCFPGLIATGQVTDVEIELVRKDGSLLPLIASATAIYGADGRFEMTRATSFDITMRRRSEEALRQSRASLQNFLDTASDLIQRLDRVGNFTYVNRAWCETLGYSAEEAMEMNVFDVLAPAFHPHCMAVLGDLTTTGQPQQLEVIFLTKDGRPITVEGSISGEIGQFGQPVTNGIFRDISVRKQAEEALRQSRDELRATNIELARVARLKDEFLSNMSHELRTPLNGILSLSESLEEGVYGALQAQQLAPVHGIIESGRHLLSLINDILDLSKIEAGKLAIEVSPVSVTSICSASLRMVAQTAKRKRLSLSSELPGEDLNILTDERRLKQILVNLLSNAVKFTPDGGAVTLRAAADAGAGAIRFSVSDTGIGIAREHLALLFQPFMQIDSRLARQHSGTGLGLSLVQRLTELLGGGVTVESEPGSGSAFTITLPLHVAQLGTPGAPRPEEASVAIGPPAILLLEENALTRKSTGDYLAARGYRVVPASDGREALDRAAEAAPSLALIALQLSSPEGLATISQLRALPSMADTPIVALTALSSARDRERCLAAGATHHLAKPVRLRELSDIIEQALAAIGGRRQYTE